MKKKLVIVCPFFPPNNHIASSRILAFAKYLAIDFDVTVITYKKGLDSYVENEAYDVYYLNNGIFDYFTNLDKNEKKIPKNLKIVFRILVNKLRIGLFFFWKNKAINKLICLQEDRKIDILLSSYMPIESHQVSLSFLNKNNNKDIFWVADMRDELSNHYSIPEAQKKYLLKFEKRLSNRADLITAVSKPVIDDFEKRLTNVSNYLEIRNGFDHNVKSTYSKDAKLKIGYFGSFYGEIKPDLFFKALIDFGNIDKFEIHIATKIHNYNVPKQLAHVVKKIEFMDYYKSIEYMSKMDCNLLILPYSGERKGVYSGKVFDYISSQRPILGLLDTSDVAAQLINQFNIGYLAESNNAQQIKTRILELYNDWQNNNIKTVDFESIKSLHRCEQVNILKKFLLEMVEQ